MKLRKGIAIGLVSLVLNSCGDKTIDSYRVEAENRQELSDAVNEFENEILIPAKDYQNAIDSIDVLIKRYAVEGGSKELDSALVEVSSHLRDSGHPDAELIYKEIENFSYKQFFRYQGNDLVLVDYGDVSNLNPNERLKIWEYYPITKSHEIIRDDTEGINLEEENQVAPEFKETKTRKYVERTHLEQLLSLIHI